MKRGAWCGVRQTRIQRTPHHAPGLFCLILVVLTAAFLRLAYVAETPGWFSDEGTHLNLAANLLRGRDQYLALSDAAVLVARLPLFDWLLAGLLGLFGGDPARGMAVLRAFTGSLGVLTTLLLYVVAQRLGGPRGAWLGLLAALVYALYPPAIVYSRLGFSYNLVAPLLLLSLWFSGEYLRAAATVPASPPAPAWRWLALAALAVGLAALTDVWAWTLLAPLAVVALAGVWRAGWGALAALGLAAAPFGLYAAARLIRAPGVFLFDLNYTLSRLSALPLSAQFALLAENLISLFLQDGLWALGLAGLFVLRPTRLRLLVLVFLWLPFVLVGRSAPLTSLSYYYLIPLLPVAALGVGALALAGLTRLARHVERRLRPWQPQRAARLGQALAAVAVLVPALYLAAANAAQLRAGYTTAIDPFLLEPADARQAAAFVNAQAAPDEVILASPGLAWLLDARAVDIQMTIAHGGVATPHLPAGLPASRWVFDPSLAQARFVMVDNLWRNWGVFHLPGLPALLAEVEQWPVAFTAGAITVYQRP